MATSKKVLFKFGSREQYESLATKQDNALYFLTDTGELYRGSVPFGQAKLYSGTRRPLEDDADCISRIVASNVIASNDLLVITNTDSTKDIFIYVDNGWLKLMKEIEPSKISSLESRVGNIETNIVRFDSIISALSGALHFSGKVEDLSEVSEPKNGDLYQVGDEEYAWNGEEWVNLGNLIDTSHLATKVELEGAVADLEALIGRPAHDEIDPETGETIHTSASGLYLQLFENAPTIIPTFDGIIAGLVPVLTGDFTTEEKEKMFMNALGNWVQVVTEGGQSYYVDPDGNRYDTVEAYVLHMLDDSKSQWETMV